MGFALCRRRRREVELEPSRQINVVARWHLHVQLHATYQIAAEKRCSVIQRKGLVTSSKKGTIDRAPTDAGWDVREKEARPEAGTIGQRICLQPDGSITRTSSTRSSR